MRSFQFKLFSIFVVSFLLFSSLSYSDENLQEISTSSLEIEYSNLDQPDANFIINQDIKSSMDIEQLISNSSSYDVNLVTIESQRSSGCSTGCSVGCSTGCSTGCSVGCSTGCSMGCRLK